MIIATKKMGLPLKAASSYGFDGSEAISPPGILTKFAN